MVGSDTEDTSSSSTGQHIIENLEVPGLNDNITRLEGETGSFTSDITGLAFSWHGFDEMPLRDFSADLDDVSLFFDEQGGLGIFPILNVPDASSQPAVGDATQGNGADDTTDRRPRYEISSNDRSMYVNYPQLYQPDKRGNPLRTSVIFQLIKHPEMWSKVDAVERSMDKSYINGAPKVSEALRDAIMATVHVILARVLDNERMGTIPSTFPPLQTVKIIFNAFFNRMAVFYPVIHPTAFEINSSAQYKGTRIQLQLLSMFASGALLTPVPEVQTFAVNLASIINQVLYDIFLRDANQTQDLWLTCTSVLITTFGIWSGNKRQMELAEALRGSYTTVHL
jgi:hypothetical protein